MKLIKLHNYSTPRSQIGTSLMEVMITLAVISIGILGIIYIQGDITSQSANNKARMEAVVLAEDRVEFYRTVKVEDLPGYAGTELSIPGVNAEFTRTTTVTEGTETYIEVTVSWQDPATEASIRAVLADINYPADS